MHLMRLIRRLRTRRAAVLVEVAIVLPTVMVLFVGTFDVVDALASWRRARAAAIAIAEAATNVAAQTGTFSLTVGTTTVTGDNQLTSSQAEVASSAIAAYFPNLPSGVSTSYGVTLSAVVFAVTTTCTATSTNCVCVTTNTTTSTGATNTISNTIGNVSPGTPGSGTSNSTTCYIANVAWSVALGSSTSPHGWTQTRACGALTPVSTSSHSSLTTLPEGLYGPYSLIVADVDYTFTPLFSKFITGPVTFLESAYLPPRIGTAANYVFYTPVTYQPTGPVCTGYY